MRSALLLLLWGWLAAGEAEAIRRQALALSASAAGRAEAIAACHAFVREEIEEQPTSYG